jgi:hypothetical protein
MVARDSRSLIRRFATPRNDKACIGQLAEITLEESGYAFFEDYDAVFNSCGAGFLI